MSEENKEEPYKSPHERRLEKHQEKNVEVSKELEHKKPKGKKKGSKFLTYLIIALIAATAFQFLFPPPKPQETNTTATQTSPPVTGWDSLSRPLVGDNWLADYSVYLCGEIQQPFPQSADIGIYTTGDGKIHIKPNKQEETGKNANLGRFFDGLKQNFSDTQLLDKKSGDICPKINQTGKVKLLINDQENTEFRNYVPRDGDKAEFRFG